MTLQHLGNRDFTHDYTLLELNHRADWQTARLNYRRLVHLWHPDRYAQRPRERAHAQQRFISLTKSYDHLRSFQRQHGRLPFEPVGYSAMDSTLSTGTGQPRRAGKHTAGGTGLDEKTGGTSRQSDAIGDADIGEYENGILGRELSDKAPTHLAAGRSTRRLWMLSAAALLLVTVSVFFVLDRTAQQKILERGRATVRAAPPSDFMPTPAQIRRSEAKGAFVKPTQ